MIDNEKMRILEHSYAILGLISELNDLVNNLAENCHVFFNNPNDDLVNEFNNDMCSLVFLVKYLSDRIKNPFKDDK